MKSSTKVIIGVVVVALIGAGVYFGNTKLQKGSFGSFSKQAGLKNICKSAPTSLYSNQPQDIKNYDYYNFMDFYNYLKKELDSLNGNVLCPYVFELSKPRVPSGEDSTNLTCKGSELTVGVTGGGNKYIQCHKQLNDEVFLKGDLYFNKDNPVARIYIVSPSAENLQQDIELQKIRVKKY